MSSSASWPPTASCVAFCRARSTQTRLRHSAAQHWWNAARLTLAYARSVHAVAGHLADCVGGIARAACETAHAVMAASGQWVLNEKALLDRAGLRGVDQVLANLTADPAVLTSAIDAAGVLFETTVETIVAS
jgi:hypothetical protein